MIACIIEFGIREGMEARHREALEPLLEEVTHIDGFVSKETFDSRNTDGKLITISYWETEEAMRQWMAHADHRTAILAGKREIFSHYDIRIATVDKHYAWQSRRG